MSLIQYSPDSRLASVGTGGSLLWDGTRSTVLGGWPRTFAPDNDMAWAPDGSYVLVTSRYNGLCCYDRGTERPVWTQGLPIGSIAVSPDGLEVALLQSNWTLMRLDLRQRRLILFPGFHFHLAEMEFSPDGRHLAVISQENSVSLLDRQGGIIWRQNISAPRCLAWSPDGSRLVVGGASRVLALDARTGKLLARSKPARVYDVSYHPGGTCVAAAVDGDVALLEPTTLRETACLDVVEPIQAVTFRPDGRQLAALSFGYYVRTFEVEPLGSPDPVAAPLAAAALEGDSVARLALADHLEESGHPLASVWGWQLRAGNLYPAAFFAPKRP